jgi:hypothetical protein
MGPNFRIQKFSKGESFVFFMFGEEHPGSGWAMNDDGAVFTDGIQIGERGKFQRVGDGYSHIEYVPLAMDRD